jgi:hypothetical protein
MTTLVLPRSASTFTLNSGFGVKPKHYRKGAARSLVVEGQAVFRSGTFRDSMGYQNTWEDVHMSQMLTNWDYLRNNKIFVDVPVRSGHPGWIVNGTEGTGKVVGYHTGLRIEEMEAPHDGNKYTYVFVDYEILDAKTADDYEAGLLRNRSSEILHYMSNAEAEFWPVYGGFAFVDIPAVEGLNFSRDTSAGQGGDGSTKLIVMFDKEIPSMTGTPGAPALDNRPPLGGAAQGQQGHVFSVNGQPTSDFAAVQRHITVLETAQAEARTAGREAFINGLATRGFIAATAIEHFSQAAAKMDDETWSLFCKGYELAQPQAAFSQHAAPAANTNGSASSHGSTSSMSADEEAVAVAKEIVAAHRSTGTSIEALKATPSYRKLVAAGLEQA